MITINFRDYMYEQITHRYVDSITNIVGEHKTISNKVPIAMLTDTRISGKCISPNLQSMINSNAKVTNGNEIVENCIPFKELIKIVNIDMEMLKSNIYKLKKNNDINLVSIGYGGFSINIINFMYLLGLEAGYTKWIKSLTIYEDDNISFSNSFRIYKDLSSINYNILAPLSKLKLLQDDNNIANEVNLVYGKFTKVYIDILKDERERKDKFFNDKTFIIGAPDFETRKILEDMPFIFTGHSGNEVEFWSKPVVDSDLTRETYGKIDLDWFFLNLLKSAEVIIDMLANHNPDELPKDTLLFRYNSKEEVNK